MRGSAGTGLIRNLIIARFAATSDGAPFAPSRSSLGKVRSKSASDALAISRCTRRHSGF